MGRRDSISSQDKPPERKLSSGCGSVNRMRTRSFGEKGKMHINRVFVGDEMDNNLKQLKKVKKSIARDNTSIFRAVCEQISSVQTDYLELRVLVEQMLRPITQKHFKDNGSTHYDRDKEIFEILADITSSRIIVYRTGSEEPTVYEGTVVEDNREIQVCEQSQYRSVYAPVYSEDIHEALAISQSIVYRTLYEDVFGYSKQSIDQAIEYIRHDIEKHSHSTLNDLYMVDHHMYTGNAPCTEKPPQFPYCACKSLDPRIYRNIEYDLYRAKLKETEHAAQNSLAVKFGIGARCLARDGGAIRNARVTAIVKHDVRRVVFEDQPNNSRDFDVSDLRPLPTSTVAHHSMHSLMNGTGGGGGQQPMQFLPGCFPPPPNMNMFPIPPPPMYLGGPVGLPPPPPLWMQSPFSPPPIMDYPLPGQQHFSHGSNEMMGVPPPPPTPVEREMSIGYSPAPADTTLDSSVFTATPLSSRKGEDGRRNRDKKPRALSAELLDSPVSARPKKTEMREQEKESRKSGRRATEGDAVGEMNRPLQPKQLQHRLSTCNSFPENDSPSMDLPTHMQHLQLNIGAKVPRAPFSEAEAARRAKLPSLLPLPPGANYGSSDWTGDDTVFTADEGTASQSSLANNRDSPLVSSSSANDALLGVNVYENAGLNISCPHINMEQFQLVNKNANYSQNASGDDLPDTLTTRFFYNLGVQFFKNNIQAPAMNGEEVRPPPPDVIPMPIFLASPLPLNSPVFFPGNGPYSMMQPSAAPPNTPAVFPMPSSMPAHLAQYYHPRVDGMPNYGYSTFADGRGGQMMEQGAVTAMTSPSPMMSPGANFFTFEKFPPNQ